jgi:hypothetical protein
VQEQVTALLNFLVHEKTPKSTVDNIKSYMLQVLGFVHNILPIPEGMTRAQHLAILRLESIFNGPMLSQYLCWLMQQRKLQDTSIKQVFHYQKKFIE